MSKWKYQGEDARYYPGILADQVEPGDVVELDEDPGDGRFTQVSDKRKATVDAVPTEE